MRGQDIDYEAARKTIRDVIEERRNYAIKNELVIPFFPFSLFCISQAQRLSVRLFTICNTILIVEQ